VAKNKRLPFVVETNNISVLALGTKFNVKAYPEEKYISTILLEGSVKLQNLKGDQDRSIILEPNQKAEYTLAQNNFNVSEIQNTSEVSWFTDTWVIERKKLGEFTKMLERHFNVKITFEEPSIREEYQFGGTIKGESIDQILDAITATSPLKYKIENRQIVLSFDKNKQSKYEKILK
jgi:ferric-dicitrate binding protein FerR (iron transport regulator)